MMSQSWICSDTSCVTRGWRYYHLPSNGISLLLCLGGGNRVGELVVAD